MLPLVAIGPTEWLIILAIALLLFGGSRLAGIGKGVGRSIREFKEEVKTVEGPDGEPETVDAEIVTPEEEAARQRQRELEAREAELAAREAELKSRDVER